LVGVAGFEPATPRPERGLPRRAVEFRPSKYWFLGRNHGREIDHRNRAGSFSQGAQMIRLVLPVRIELTTSPLLRYVSTITY